MNRPNSHRRTIARVVAATAVIGAGLLTPASSSGYLSQQRWSATASGSTSFVGDPITLTWSLPPDGVPTSASGVNKLLASLDKAFDVGGVPSDDLTTRPWFPLLQSAVERWSELSGVRMVYEPHDDGALIGPSGGVLGVRGDVRIGGHMLNGAGGALALSNFPNSGDVLLDTADIAFLTLPGENYLRLRNVLTHEVGHALGLGHVESDDSNSLMEPQLHLSFDGPQIDDIRGMHWMYGDVNEWANGGRGNDFRELATPLGALSAGISLGVGLDAAKTDAINAAYRDFVSITSTSDRDFYAFSTDAPLRAELTLTPLGGTYHQGLPGGDQSLIDASARGNLYFELFNADSEGVLATANSAPAGAAESLTIDLATPGDYVVRVASSFHAVQLYQLELRATPIGGASTPITPEPTSLAVAAIALTTAGSFSNRCAG